MKPILLRGRYGKDTFSIKRIGRSVVMWELELVGDGMFCRYGSKADSGELSFVDPCGGPFVSVGTVLHYLDRRLPMRNIIDIRRASDGGVRYILTTAKL